MITDSSGTQNYGISIDSTQNTQSIYTGAKIINTAGTSTDTLIGISSSIQDGQLDNVGVDIGVLGTSGNGTGLKILNSIGNTGTTQYGEFIEVNGIEVVPPFTPLSTYKWGSYISISGAANSNIGLEIGAVDGSKNYAIITDEGESIFNQNNNNRSHFRVLGQFDSNLIFVDAGTDAVGIGQQSPITKLDVLGDYRFVHDPNVELPLPSLDPSGYGDIVTFGNPSSGFLPGLVHYLDTATNEWTPTDPTSAATSTNLLALALGVNPSLGMLIRGYAQTSFANTPFTLGAPLYLSYITQPPPFPPIIGVMSNTAPTGTGEIVRIVGYCVGDTTTYDRIYFNPDNAWIEI